MNNSQKIYKVLKTFHRSKRFLLAYHLSHKSGFIPLFLVLINIISILLTGCIEPFEPKIEKYDHVLVVDGILTNEPGSCEVILSRTYPYSKRQFISESGAVVKIIDDLGNETILIEKNAGKYIPEDEEFAGEVGRKYKVSVETTNGEICESNFEELKESVPIGDIYYEYKGKENGKQGLQLYLDTEDFMKKSFYYAWDFIETWEFHVPYTSNIYVKETICYKQASSRLFLTATTKNYKEDKVIGFPLYFIDNTTNRLSSKYSSLVKQYVLTEETYIFYENLKNINENVGSLFDRIPIVLTGNIRNKLHPEQPVLGNFQVSGVSEMRIFIERFDLPDDLLIPNGFEYCRTELLSPINSRHRVDSLLGVGWVVKDSLLFDAEGLYLNLIISSGCFDCTMNGDPEIPNFW